MVGAEQTSITVTFGRCFYRTFTAYHYTEYSSAARSNQLSFLIWLEI
jgi:hypothetical protein